MFYNCKKNYLYYLKRKDLQHIHDNANKCNLIQNQKSINNINIIFFFLQNFIFDFFTYLLIDKEKYQSY